MVGSTRFDPGSPQTRLRGVMESALLAVCDAMISVYEERFSGGNWEEVVARCCELTWFGPNPQAGEQLRNRAKDLTSLAAPLFLEPRPFPDACGHLHALRAYRNGFVHRHQDDSGGEMWSQRAHIEAAFENARRLVRAIGAPECTSDLDAALAQAKRCLDQIEAKRTTATQPPSASLRTRHVGRISLGGGPKDRTGFAFSPEQRAAVDRMEDWFYRGTQPRLALAGPAGSGKTAMMSELLAQLSLPPERVRIAAPTTKARDVLRHRLPRAFSSRCVTLAGFLWQFRKPDYMGEDAIFQREGPKRLETNVHLVIVDESSMVTRRDAELLSRYPRVLYVGDPNQLPPVTEDPDDGDAEVLARPDVCLERVYRQSPGSAIRSAAEAAGRGEVLSLFGSDGVSYLDESDGVLPPDRFDELLLSHDVVLTGRNASRIRINARVRQLVGRAQLRGDAMPVAGDILVSTERYRAEGQPEIENGDRMEVLEVLGTERRRDDAPIDDWVVRVRLLRRGEEDSLATLVISSQMLAGSHVKGSIVNTRDVSGPRSKVLRAEWGYAITVHRAQGSEWPRVLVIDDLVHDHRIPRRRWSYTAFSRAYEQLTIVRPRKVTTLF